MEEMTDAELLGEQNLEWLVRINAITERFANAIRKLQSATRPAPAAVPAEGGTTWTTDNPTQRGHYWWRPMKVSEAYLADGFDIFQVQIIDGVVHVYDEEKTDWVPAEPFGCVNGLWSGPLQPPAPPESQPAAGPAPPKR